MIRYAYDPDDVRTRIAALDAKWATKAAKRAKAIQALGRFEEASSIWSAVKPVFMAIQHNKCVFCERQLEDTFFGPVEWDLEHFRPKSNVARWPDPGRHPDLTYAEDLGDGVDTGYYWLAYELRNYAASCKVCNTRFKLNYFPVRQPRAQAVASVAALAAEGPLLCYPLGDIDDDPEELVTFSVTTAVPVHSQGVKALRGRVIIDFFGLNRRDTLHRERARMIAALGALLDERDRGVASTQVMSTIAAMARPHVPHAACLRAFRRLWDQDPPNARRAYDLCRAYGFAEAGTAPPQL